jgi:hypothetical protein
MRRAFSSGVLVMALLVPPAAAPLAQDVFAYPSKGQSQEQQDKDNFECHRWAKEQSGFDPGRAPQASSPPPREKSTGPGALGGAAIGAGAGLVGGAIAGKPGTGALVGAGAGGLFGGLHSRNRKKQNQEARQDWERQQAAQNQQGRNAFNRAFSACMSSRGYTIQ